MLDREKRSVSTGTLSRRLRRNRSNPFVLRLRAAQSSASVGSSRHRVRPTARRLPATAM